MLTDTACRKAVPGPKEIKLVDAHGLFLRIQPTGTKSWCWKYRFAGREKRLTLGRYPVVSLREARAARDKARAKLAEGIDPGAELQRRKRQNVKAENFEAIARAWHDQKKSKLTPRYAKQVLERLERNIFREFGSHPIRSIEPGDVLAALRRIEARGSLTMAREVRTHVSEIFVWAIASGLATNDPAAIIGKALAPSTGGRRPAVLSIEHARKVLAKIEAVPLAHWSTKLASRLIALTAARPGTVRLADRAEFEDLDGPEPIWRIPAAKMKLSAGQKADSAFDFTIPLARQSVEVVKAAIAAGGSSTLLFPAENGKPMSDSTISKLYRDAGLRDRHVPHGWRATFSTVMNERAAELDNAGDRAIIDMMLAHVQGGVEIAYNRAAYMPRRRALAQEWADLLTKDAQAPSEIHSGPRRKAVSLREAGHDGLGDT